jgi:hypothetical protein
VALAKAIAQLDRAGRIGNGQCRVQYARVCRTWVAAVGFYGDANRFCMAVAAVGTPSGRAGGSHGRSGNVLYELIGRQRSSYTAVSRRGSLRRYTCAGPISAAGIAAR